MNPAASEWIQQRKTGCILYTSPSKSVRDASLKAMAQFAVCPEVATRGITCDCATCFNIKQGTHPHVSVVKEEEFDEKMRTLYSLPTPIVQLPDAHRLTIPRQTKMLIWLESIGRSRFVMLTSDSEFSVLPTIRSRSVIFTEILKYRLSEEEEFKVTVFLSALFAGKEKFDSISTPDDAKLFAYQLRQAVVQEIQNRLSKPSKKKLIGSDLELATLMKVLERFLSDPMTHNLKLLLTGFSMLPLQSQR